MSASGWMDPLGADPNPRLYGPDAPGPKPVYLPAHPKPKRGPAVAKPAAVEREEPRTLPIEEAPEKGAYASFRSIVLDRLRYRDENARPKARTLQEEIVDRWIDAARKGDQMAIKNLAYYLEPRSAIGASRDPGDDQRDGLPMTVKIIRGVDMEAL